MGRTLSPKRLADGGGDGLVGGEAEPAFLGDFSVAHPDGEFAAVAFDQFGVEPEFFFDRGRRTEGPGSVSHSDRAEADAHGFHG